jgi:hypothetical protein
MFADGEVRKNIYKPNADKKCLLAVGKLHVAVKESGLLDCGREHVKKCIKQICFQVEKVYIDTKTCDQRTNNSVSNTRYLWQI